MSGGPAMRDGAGSLSDERVAERIDEAVAVRPSARQLAWQRTEFYGFIHFGMNTMTDREWGDGAESPALFDPSDVDVDQWVGAFAAAGMRALILTCKHHDGFALWPSAVSEHTVAASPWRGGQGDLVREVSDACAARGLAFGVYLSPWDRTEASYGTGVAYDDFFVAQLTELLTGYGEIFSVWFDGANGEGPDGRVQLYDWDRYHETVRRLQPGAVISVCGPDVRWCGNEAGETRPDEWSVVPESLRDAERTADSSQKIDDGAFSRAPRRSNDADLGSREALVRDDQPLVWYPAEVNTSIRPGWFHHPAEDDQVRSADELFELWRRSVGGNATFLLNVTPDRHGRLPEPDVESLRGLGERIGEIDGRVVVPSRVTTSSGRADAATLARPGDHDTSWCPSVDDARPRLEVGWDEPRRVEGVIVGEDIVHGQQIDGAEVRVRRADGQEAVVARVGSIGQRRHVDLDEDDVVTVELWITSRRGPVHLSTFAVLEPRPGS